VHQHLAAAASQNCDGSKEPIIIDGKGQLKRALTGINLSDLAIVSIKSATIARNYPSVITAVPAAPVLLQPPSTKVALAEAATGEGGVGTVGHRQIDAAQYSRWTRRRKLRHCDLARGAFNDLAFEFFTLIGTVAAFRILSLKLMLSGKRMISTWSPAAAAAK